MLMNDRRSELTEKIVEYLRAQGIVEKSQITGRPLAEELAEVVVHDCLDWMPGGVEDLARPFDYLIGFAFGHRFQNNGTRLSGPINERLAQVLLKEYDEHDTEKRPEVWAQWEIADCLLGTRIDKAGHLRPVYPDISIRLDEVDYASTVTVMKKIKASVKVQDSVRQPTALVIAHPDHSRRCLRVVESFGVKARAYIHSTDGSEWYDHGSGQLWTRLRHLYLLHDMLGALNFSRDQASQRAIDDGFGGMVASLR